MKESKWGVTLQVWESGDEYGDTLIDRVNMPKSQVSWFTKKMARIGYYVKEESELILDWRGYYYNYLKKKRNERRRWKYDRSHHPEKHVFADSAIARFYDKALLNRAKVNLFIQDKAIKHRTGKSTIKFRRYQHGNKDNTKS